MDQQLEWNPTSPPENRFFTRLLHSILVFNPSFYHFILNVSYSLPNIFAIFRRKALLWHGTAERKKDWKEEKRR